jgi:hypothetical protein
MNIKRSKSGATALALFCVLAACYAAGTSAAPAGPPAPAECEGDACAAVTLTFDEARQQYRAQNNSPERWAQVSASNLSASAAACLPPGKGSYLPLKSVVAPYRAEYAGVKCGRQDEGR